MEHDLELLIQIGFKTVMFAGSEKIQNSFSCLLIIPADGGKMIWRDISDYKHNKSNICWV